MAEQTTSSIVIAAPPDDVMAVIVDFAAYPEWVQGMRRAEVREREDDGTVRTVYFELEATPIKDAYTLAYDWDGDHILSWHLVEGHMLKAMDGTYALREASVGTEVTYRLSVDIAIPMIGMLRRKAEKVIIDNALKGLKKRVEARG